MSKYIMPKHTSKTIVKDIQGNESLEYIVEEGATLTLVLTCLTSSDAHVNVRLAGKGAKAVIVGIIVGKGASSSILHTLQQHQAPETTSNLLVKGVFTGSSTFLYDGAIRVEKRAQKTDAYQRNENLLLCPLAHAESKPSLEILANDVRCTHGATVSSLDKNQLWYMSSRGISKDEARTLLVSGFLESALKDISFPSKDRIVHEICSAV